MTNNWGDTEDAEQEQAGSGFRQWTEKVQAENKELKQRLEALEKVATQATVANTFETLGVSRNLANLYQGDADPEKISTWVNDVRTALGGAPASAPDASKQPVLNSSDQEQYQKLSEAGTNGADGTSTMDDFQARIAQAGSIDELHAIWQNVK